MEHAEVSKMPCQCPASSGHQALEWAVRRGIQTSVDKGGVENALARIGHTSVATEMGVVWYVWRASANLSKMVCEEGIP